MLRDELRDLLEDALKQYESNGFDDYSELEAGKLAKEEDRASFLLGVIEAVEAKVE